jgi:hypothetical protein
MREIALIVATLMITPSAASAAKTMICIGEPMSGRPYSQTSGGDIDSGVGDGCFFSAYEPIGRQIEKVCHIGDIGLDVRGQPCRIEAVVAGKVIRRIIKIERLP